MSGGTLVVGSITQDFVTGAGPALEASIGGSATYFALAARHFGPVSVVGSVGRDREADVRRLLEFADLSQVTADMDRTHTWNAVRETEGGDARTIDGFADGWQKYQPAMMPREMWPNAVFLGSCDPRVQNLVAEHAPDLATVGADTMDVFIEQRRPEVEKLAKRAMVMFLTGAEMEQLSRTRGLAAASAYMLSEFPLTAVVVKRGAAGALLVTRDGTDRLPAFPVRVVDPTGAGDAMAGAFMGRLAEIGQAGLAKLSSQALLGALRWGMVAASFACEGLGVTGLAATTRDQLERRVHEYREVEAPGQARQA